MQVSFRGVFVPFIPLLLSAVLLLPRSACANPRNDFDADSFSDVALISIENNGALDWAVVSGPASTTPKSAL